MQVNLFVIPYAGGSASIYRKWSVYIPTEIQLIPLELPGRGARFREPLLDSADLMIRDLLQRIQLLFPTPYAIFGHSLGCLLAVELTNEIAKHGYPLPTALFLSGRNPPDIKSTVIHSDLSDQELVEELIKMGGTPQEFMLNRELWDIYLPIIRSDLKVVETYECNIDTPLDCTIHILNGTHDKNIDMDHVNNWARFTSKLYSTIWFEGNHFYIHNFEMGICKYITQFLL